MVGTSDPAGSRERARAFGNYIRSLRQNCHGRGKGKSLRQLSEETGIPLSVLSRGERGLQDLRKPWYIERLAPALGVRPSVMKRVAALVTPMDVVELRSARPEPASPVLWARLQANLEKLRPAPADVLEALLLYVEFLVDRVQRGERKVV
mgnify:CR=1 FL=1